MLLLWPLPLPLDSLSWLFRRIFLADGAEVGMSSPRPFAAFSRPCLRDRGEARDSVVASSSPPFRIGVAALIPSVSTPKNG